MYNKTDNQAKISWLTDPPFNILNEWKTLQYNLIVAKMFTLDLYLETYVEGFDIKSTYRVWYCLFDAYKTLKIYLYFFLLFYFKNILSVFQKNLIFNTYLKFTIINEYR